MSVCTSVVFEMPTPALPPPMASVPATWFRSKGPAALTRTRPPLANCTPEPAPPAPFSVNARVLVLTT